MILECITITIFVFFKHANSQSHCVGTCYSGRLFPEPQDIFHGKHLKGYSYNNITTDDPVKCYSSCVQDCRCKACQMKDARCELLDEDKTSKTLTDELGYVYFDLKQTMYKGHRPPMVSQGCYNGCCRSQPCMNGGTCVEHCNSPKNKFTCICQKWHHGKICEKTISSCMDVRSASSMIPKDGVYELKRFDNRAIIPVYCAFQDDPRQAWTLIESFSRNQSLFKGTPFYIGNTQNRNLPPSWDLFRLGLLRVQYFRRRSTLFRATCDFPNRMSLTPDLLIGRLSDVDIINEKDIAGCRRYKFIDIRGHNCTNCTANTRHGTSFSWHFHLDITHQGDGCDFHPPVTVQDADNFGFYDDIDGASKCTATPQSTTQWWLGEEK
ncbi:uncharacterized protein LOC110231784 [Exaiptasia diaphana]|uniref:EGF-like domain-containing protein n=1 Tax=Exaiptasia diaphana TaxID=2652724 RepID=A0A913WQB4_EXADI|nr:uncharacterized protein LOC110231784 [Exaiptasia diaphana]